MSSSPSSPAPETTPAASPDPIRALDPSIRTRAPGTLIATASSTALHVRLVGRSGDRVELLVDGAAAGREAFGPLASVILLVMRGDRAQVLTGRIDGVPRRQGRGWVLGVACRHPVVQAEARQTHRLSLPAGHGLGATLLDGRGRRFAFLPSDISGGGIGGLLPEAPERALAPGTQVSITLQHADLGQPLVLTAEVRMRQLAAPDRPGRCGLVFRIPDGPLGAAQRQQLDALVACCEQSLGLDAVA